MSDGDNIAPYLAPYLAHFGIEVSEDELAHYGKKGMKWGVRNDDRGGSGRPAGKGWTEDQKQKARNVAVIAGVVGLGAAYVALQVYSRSAVGPASKATATSFAKSAGSAAKQASGKKIAEGILKAKGSTKITMDPELRKFVKDAPARILADQKGWSNSLGKSLGGIQKEDAAFMAEYIKNYAPKALGA